MHDAWVREKPFRRLQDEEHAFDGTPPRKLTWAFRKYFNSQKTFLIRIFMRWLGLFLLVLFLLVLSGCTAPLPPSNSVCPADAKLCPDGTGVGRDAGNNCAFFECPAPLPCDAERACPAGSSCYAFSTSTNVPFPPHCVLESSDVCLLACGSPDCRIAESFPPQVFCS
ncbi:MAG: hypothetical protein HY917_00965 [Candidatus Diapherotrites archaeon]|nr:hypothetical protein [Candidatus Diapherotrites archaeon]